KEVLLKRLEKYIKTVVGRYKGKIYAWDVVNEVLDMGDMRYTDWYEIAGDEFIEKAFIWAHEADPNAKLFINEVDTTEKHKMDALYNLVKGLKEKNIPVHGIGMQYHVTLDYPSVQSVSDSLKKFDELGLEIHITELDMSINQDPNLKAENAAPYQLLLQGFRYKELFRVFKEHKSVTNVTVWGFHDGHTWLTYFPVKKADWPLLFDKSFKPKYAYWGIVDPSKLPKTVEGMPEKHNLIGKAIRGTPVLDGKEDTVWKKAPEFKVTTFVMGKGSTGSARVLWDDSNLYVFFKVKDKKLSKTSANAYEQDSIEIFVDEKNNKSFEYQEDDAQYRINFTNDVTLNGFPSAIKSKAVKVKGGYNVEVLIPFKTIKPQKGTQLGFDLQINDDPGTGKRESISKWNDPTNESYRNTSGFGTLELQ
ncbi:MAG TPA: endo-1,4-beta-xylanase, partial [Spirochaetota bacterium]|nr:endo-1,4-beta-xylanase [Spirochaetota bacterium]